MPKRYIGIIALILIVFGVSYVLSRQDNKPAEPSTTTNSTSPPTTGGKSLDLSGQQLTALSDDVLNQTDVTTLNVSNNQLTSLPSGISKMVNLQVLNIENNRLESLPPEIARLTKLIEILANNNRMTSLPGELGTMTWLKLLDISGNDIPSGTVDQVKSQLQSTQVKS